MTRTQRGHRDAAQLGDQAANPYDFKTQPIEHDAWVTAAARVNAFRQQGLDPNGHHPLVPHLCERDVTKVCNCCASCKTACWSEDVVDRIGHIVDRIPGSKLLRKIFK